MRNFFVYLILVFCISCSNYPNEDVEEETEADKVELIVEKTETAKEESTEEVIIEEVANTYPCDRSFDKTFAFNIKCNFDQYGVFHREELKSKIVYRIVYQSQELRIIIYKILNGTESIHKVYENISCELGKNDNQKEGTLNSTMNMTYIFIYKSSNKPVLSIYKEEMSKSYSEIKGCNYYYNANEKMYYKGIIYIPDFNIRAP
jgi:hypothetical protein